MTWGNNSVFQLLIIQGSQAVTGLFLYNGLGAPGNPPQFAAVASGVTSDPFGNAITSSKILIQGNVITESGGIFRTAAAAPLIQLDGPHNAVLVYDAAAALKETIAPVATNDGLGNTVQAGFTAYAPGLFAQLIAAGLLWGGTGITVSPALGSGAAAQLQLSSGQTAGNTVEAILSLNTAATGQVATAQLQQGAFELTEGAAPAADGGALAGPKLFGSNATGMARFVADGVKGDSEPYDTGTNHRVNTANVPLSTAAFTSIFPDFPVAAIAYRLTADLLISLTAAAAATVSLQLQGPAVGALTSVKWQATYEAGTGESVFAGHSIGSLASVTLPGGATFPASSVIHVKMSAYVTFTAASGTNLNLQAQLNGIGPGGNVSLGSTMDVSPVG